jgi:hypothetical protein
MTALKRLAFPLQSPEFGHHVNTDRGRAIHVLGKGSGLHWDARDADLSVPGLVDQLFRTRKFMAQQAG